MNLIYIRYTSTGEWLTHGQCPNCGTPNTSAKFCAQCGAPLAPATRSTLPWILVGALSIALVGGGAKQ